MKDFTIRHNKYYTSILINRASRDNFIRSCELARNVRLNGNKPVVIKLSKRGADSYKQAYNEEQLMRETPVGKSFEIMGVIFKVIDQRPEAYENGSIELQYSYYDELGEHVLTEDMLLFYEQSLVEHVFQAVTNGCLLNF